MEWVDMLKGHIVGIDTSPLIYFTEGNPLYEPIVNPFFETMRRHEFIVITSVITLLEVLVYPIRVGDTVLAQRYRELLSNTNFLTTRLLDKQIAEEAARLRASYNLRTPDAIQLATAIVAKASFFLTNDKRLASVKEVNVLVLDDFKTSAENGQN